MPVGEAFGWLSAGWRDFWIRPASASPMASQFSSFRSPSSGRWSRSGATTSCFQPSPGFLIVAPFLAIGLYEKSRAIEEGERPTMGRMLQVRPRAGAQVFFTGLLLCLLMLLWMRAAVLL